MARPMLGPPTLTVCLCLRPCRCCALLAQVLYSHRAAYLLHRLLSARHREDNRALIHIYILSPILSDVLRCSCMLRSMWGWQVKKPES